VKLSTLAYVAAGYVLGARAGRERYDQIVRVARRVAGSQTVQATAGVVQGQLDQFAAHARQVFAGKLAGPSHPAGSGVNGHRR
jgi:urocanate hydratase